MKKPGGGRSAGPAQEMNASKQEGGGGIQEVFLMTGRQIELHPLPADMSSVSC